MGSANKELPKISDEFKPASQPSRPAPPSEARQPQAGTRMHQPVTRPAPMAPRTPPRAVQPPPQQQAAPVRQVAPQPQPQPIPQGASGLGDRLRAERQAAEKLAEQRVAQARTTTARGPEPRPLQPPPARQQPAAERPKFSFSPEELAKDKREQVPPPPEREFPSFSSTSKPGPAAAPPPPLTPPRPALGGNASQVQPQPQAPRPQPPRPAANTGPAPTTFQPRFGNQPPPQQQPAGGNYRSLDPPPGGFAPKSKPYADTSAFREDPLARRAPPPVNREYDSYRRGPALPPTPTPAYGEENDGPSLGDYRRNRPPVPARGRKPAYDEDVNEVFEDEEPPRPQRRRASAQDYNRAYRDYEEGYEQEAPRKRGPWPWLLAIIAGILIVGGLSYYYLNYYRHSGSTAGNVPVIESPEQPAKTAPETSGGSTLGGQGATQPNSAEQRKKIYDRILGDDEVGGSNKVVPTQEQPQVVEPTGDNGTGDDGTQQRTAPQNGAGDNNSSEPLPLPLPPPGSDQQGALPKGTNQQTAALGAGNKSSAPQPIPEPTSTSTTDTDSGAPVPGQLTKSTQHTAAQPPPQAEEVSEPEPLPVQPEKPAKPKLRAEKKPAKKVATADEPGAGQDGGVEPLVLVPPAQGNNQAQDLQTQNTQTQIAEPDLDQPKAQTAAAEQKSKSFFNFGNSGKRKLTGKAAERASSQGATGNWANSPDPNSSPSDADTADAPQPQQIAAVQPEPEPLPTTQAIEPAPQQAKPSSGGFIAQLASFRSEAEARAEFDRLSSKHGNVLNGLSPRIVKANIAGGSRYRLAVGPLASRAAASKICNSLIAAGERDCLVRGN